jgi:arylsulfatase A-like enzyme/Flp pilus assembly protein TadD
MEMKRVLLLVGIGLVSACGPSEIAPGEFRGANLLLVTIDTLRPDRLGAYGSTAGLTPHLDRLAEEGIVFEDVLAHVPLTLPSHTTLFTAKLPPRHGVHDNGTFRVGAEQETLALRLKTRGYETAAFVGAFVLDARFGLDRGFDRYDDYYGEKRSFASFTELERPAESVLAPAAAWLEGARRGPWFAWIHLYDPHAPYEAPEPFRSRYASDPYGAEVAYVDSALGAFLSRLGSRGLLEKTLVVVVADHGESLGEHGEATHGTFAYNATLSVPWILSAKGLEPARFSPRVRLVDVAPTVLDLLGIDPPSAIDGGSLRAFLRAPAKYEPPDSYFEALNPHLTRDWAPLRGVVRGPYKFIDLPIAELYDLAADPKEETNVISGRSALASELHSALESEIEGSAPLKPSADEETMKRLESLGYLVAPTARERKTTYSKDDDPKRLIGFVGMHDEASNRFQEGKTEEALALLREILEKQPRSSFAYQKLAYALHQLGRTAEAVRVLEEAVSRGVTDLSLLALLGSYLMETSDLPRALALLEGLAADHPDFAEAHNYLGVAYARMGRAEDAERELARVLELDPSSASAENNLGSLALARGDDASAVRHLERALELDPGSASASNGLGVARAHSGDLDGAIAAWRRAVELSPSQFDAMLNLARALSDRSRLEAISYLERFIREAPQDRYREDLQRSRALLREWRAADPTN